ncbi:BadF/BadG/BcrA/BcrD ATPase family protein [Paenibacillus terrigena]|uniref:BadF/BadG/BcrA/BcrD ATPase family protein n=1 Tax=Paenibacillus terrigena TaxID=369333 RepID=UPI0028D2B91D|nr:BadF/BadG/BcrA/BcrD ATPase family protein [Paenibacillus terrigena]
MPYYLSADGGGTKLTAVLFNDRYEVLGVGRGQAINYASQVDIAGSIQNCLASCLQGYSGITIQKVYYAMPASTDVFMTILRQHVIVHEEQWLSEGKMALLAGIVQHEGIVALSGTGSGVFRVAEEEQHLGGWGHLLGDLGSGYEIGQDVIQAVLRNFEDRGPVTRLKQLLIDTWQVQDRLALIHHVYQAANPRRQIASAAILGAEAAAQGDEVAQHIFVKAGEAMAEQTNEMLDRDQKESGVSVMIAGSAWKGCKTMYDRFCERIHEEHPSVQIHIPRFEPALGGLFAQFYAEDAGSSDRLATSVAQLIEDRHAPLMYRVLW